MAKVEPDLERKGSVRERLLSYEQALAANQPPPASRLVGSRPPPFSSSSTGNIAKLRAQFDSGVAGQPTKSFAPPARSLEVRRATSGVLPGHLTPSAALAVPLLPPPPTQSVRARVGCIAKSRGDSKGTPGPFPSAEARDGEGSTPVRRLAVPSKGFAQARYAAASASPSGGLPPKATTSPQAKALPLPKAKGPPKRKLANISELRVWRAGIQELFKLLVTNAIDETSLEALSHMPKKPDGSALVRGSLLPMLIRREIDIRSCMEADISAAQPDLKHLSFEQLLSLRVPCLEFVPVADRQAGHKSFLEILDLQLHEKLTRRLLGFSDTAPGSPVTPKSARPKLEDKQGALRVLGARIVLTLGAVEAISNGWSKAASVKVAEASLPAIPASWVIALDKETYWPYDICLLDTCKPSLQLLEDAASDLVKAASGNLVAAATSTTSSADGMLYWEIAVLDPRIDNIMEEIHPLEDKLARQLTQELRTTLRSRSAARVDLGVTPSEVVASDKPAQSEPADIKGAPPVRGLVSRLANRIDSTAARSVDVVAAKRVNTAPCRSMRGVSGS